MRPWQLSFYKNPPNRQLFGTDNYLEPKSTGNIFFGNCAYYYISNYILILVTIMYLFIVYSLCISCCVDQKLIYIFPSFYVIWYTRMKLQVWTELICIHIRNVRTNFSFMGFWCSLLWTFCDVAFFFFFNRQDRTAELYDGLSQLNIGDESILVARE